LKEVWPDSFVEEGSLAQNIHESRKAHGNWEIYLMRVDGERVQLTDDPVDDLAPDWSPDGLKIAFSSNRDVTRHIYIMNVAAILRLSS